MQRYRFEFVYRPESRFLGGLAVGAFNQSQQCVIYQGSKAIAVTRDAETARDIVDALNKVDAK